MSFFRLHDRITTTVSGPSRTKQGFKRDADINNIMRQYQTTGFVSHLSARRPTYQTLPSDLDFQAALNTVLSARDTFQALPSAVRAHFRNDPAAFLAACQDENRRDELAKLGLIDPEPEPRPVPTEAKASQEPKD